MQFLTKFKKFNFRIFTALIVGVVIISTFSQVASAAQITGRKVTIGSSVAGATTTYSFTFTVPTTGTAIKSFAAQACDTASGTCTQTGAASGFSSAGAGTLPSQPTGLGAASGWTSNVATTSALRALNASNATNPSGSQTVSFQSVTNPTATNSTFFFRITTYSDSAWTTPIDTGTVATSTAGQITVTASIDESIAFTLAAATVPLGTLTTSSTGAGTSSMTVSTNASSGYNVTVNGSTLSLGGLGVTNIGALATQTASTLNTPQFGLNLMSNTTPAIGTAVSGTGSGAPTANYGTTNQFRFVTGDSVATATAPTNSNTYTTSYIANIPGAQAAGSYSTQLTYIATANY